MHRYDKQYSLYFEIVDKLTEDADTMIHEQENRSECIRTMFLDFTRVNGIINNYTEIPTGERLERFFGYSGYPEKAADAPRPNKKERIRRCSCSFILSPHTCFPDHPDRLANDVLTMLYLQDNESDFIRTLFLDFIRANGIVENYVKIPEKERLERFFGYTARVLRPAKQPDRVVETRQEKGFENRTCHPEAAQAEAGSGVTCAMPDGITIRIIVEQASK